MRLFLNWLKAQYFVLLLFITLQCQQFNAVECLKLLIHFATILRILMQQYIHTNFILCTYVCESMNFVFRLFFEYQGCKKFSIDVYFSKFRFTIILCLQHYIFIFLFRGQKEVLTKNRSFHTSFLQKLNNQLLRIFYVLY